MRTKARLRGAFALSLACAFQERLKCLFQRTKRAPHAWKAHQKSTLGLQTKFQQNNRSHRGRGDEKIRSAVQLHGPKKVRLMIHARSASARGRRRTLKGTRTKDGIEFNRITVFAALGVPGIVHFRRLPLLRRAMRGSKFGPTFFQRGEFRVRSRLAPTNSLNRARPPGRSGRRCSTLLDSSARLKRLHARVLCLDNPRAIGHAPIITRPRLIRLSQRTCISS